MLNKNLKSQLQGTLPSGITFRGDNALWVKKSKSFIHNGEERKDFNSYHQVRYYT